MSEKPVFPSFMFTSWTLVEGRSIKSIILSIYMCRLIDFNSKFCQTLKFNYLKNSKPQTESELILFNSAYIKLTVCLPSETDAQRLPHDALRLWEHDWKAVGGVQRLPFPAGYGMVQQWGRLLPGHEWRVSMIAHIHFI